jgi:hypothetical protein
MLEYRKEVEKYYKFTNEGICKIRDSFKADFNEYLT